MANIKKGVELFLMGVGGLAIIGGISTAAILGYIAWSKPASSVDKSPKIPRETSYQGVKLGSTYAEVKYALGDPDFLLNSVPDKEEMDVTEKSNIPKGKSYRDYSNWGFKKDDEIYLRIDFNTESQIVEGINCFSEKTSCPPMYGITQGTTEDDLKAKLGKPTFEFLSESSGSKTMSYRHLGAAFKLEKMRVTRIYIGDTIPIGLAPTCTNKKEICPPWERNWGNQKPVAGAIVRNSGVIMLPVGDRKTGD